METHRFLAFDCGATSGRAILGTFSDEGFKMREVYRFPNQALEIGGRWYWLLAGTQCVNLHEIYGDFGGKFVDRDQVGVEHFQSWID